MNYELIKDLTTEFIRKYNEELKEKYKSPLPEIKNGNHEKNIDHFSSF